MRSKNAQTSPTSPAGRAAAAAAMVLLLMMRVASLLFFVVPSFSAPVVQRGAPGIERDFCDNVIYDMTSDWRLFDASAER